MVNEVFSRARNALKFMHFSSFFFPGNDPPFPFPSSLPAFSFHHFPISLSLSLQPTFPPSFRFRSTIPLLLRRLFWSASDWGHLANTAYSRYRWTPTTCRCICGDLWTTKSECPCVKFHNFTWCSSTGVETFCATTPSSCQVGTLCATTPSRCQGGDILCYYTK